jgi:pectin methylesterase-like acyl-CoA thioesterase
MFLPLHRILHRSALSAGLAWLAIMAVPSARSAVAAPQFFPAADATAVCADTPLRLTFDAPPTLGTGGKIQIFDASNNALVESIDIGLGRETGATGNDLPGSRPKTLAAAIKLNYPTAIKTIGGLPNCRYYPVLIEGNEVGIYPRNGALGWHKAYYVTIAPDVFKVGGDSYAGIVEPTAWRFTTKAAPPAPGTTKLTVAADGTGDFCTVQGALDFIPDGNTTPTTIFLRKGTYTEIVFFTNKHAITLQGEDRRQSVIAYANNARFNNAGGNPYATPGANPSASLPAHGGSTYHRGVFMAHRVNDLVLTNLTIRDTTPHGGTQAEAIILNGTKTARAIVKDVDLYSFQDTLQINGQAYVSNCHIEGDVDFMWGNGPTFFENCVCLANNSNAWYTQIRNPGQTGLENRGFVYFHCTLAGLPGVSNEYLSRIETSRFPNSEVVLIDCVLGSSVKPVGWQLERNPPQDDGMTPRQVRFWEYRSHTAEGAPADVSQRAAFSRQLTLPDDAATVANYSDPVYVLGDGWNPKHAAIFAP